jgi:hypothetical protein
VLLTLAGVALAMPVLAQTAGPPTMAFDGKYAGVSADVSKSLASQRKCPREHIPDTLTITNGAVHSPKDRWTGAVNSQGSVVLRNKRSMRVDAQIDKQGTISGRYQGPACAVDYVWRKQPR